MEFIDKVKIKVKAGNGGDGLVAFKRVKYNPLAGPSGGDGGDGGNIIFEADSNKSTLLDLRYNRFIKANDGAKGKTNKMHGESASDVIVKVPIGTIVKDANTNEFIADLDFHAKRVIIAKAGKGGLGNIHFASARNNAPEFAKIGGIGEEKEIIIEIKLLADVGLVGYPSVGKSTFLSMVSKARPEIADYPFTTLKPQLGIVRTSEGDSFVVSDLPGLIKDAHKGKGLGLEFLRHIERTRVILHIIDMSAMDGRDPIEDYKIINNELYEYHKELLKRPMIVLANKMDDDNAKINLDRFKKAFPDIEVYPAITLLGEGLDKVLYRLNELLKTTPKFPLVSNGENEEIKIYEFKEKPDFEIYNEGNGVYRIIGEKIKKLFEQIDFNNDESILRFAKKLKSMGVEDALKEKGAKHLDKVYIENYGFDFIDE